MPNDLPTMNYPTLPLSELYDDFCQALSSDGSLLLEAEPGAGKSTLAPLWVLDQLGGEAWLIQPRVLAAISVAKRLASLRGEPVGKTVGFQVPFNRQTSSQTKLVVMTPGIFLQRLLHQPELDGVAAVMLDEIHERSVDQDLSWAFMQEAAVLNDELRLILMSATPDERLRQQVDAALYSPGRCFPVETQYCPAKKTTHNRGEALAEHVWRALQTVPNWASQTVLVFLPGWRDIEACRQVLEQANPRALVLRLHSRVASQEQARALDAHIGPRIILATNIAETSLTIADVTLVIDSGLAREPAFEQRTGVTRLQTRRIASANAEQRCGRAGRVQAGHCIRLWSQGEALATHVVPAIRRSDYLPLALKTAHWGTPAKQLPWLEAPNPLAIQAANQQLQQWQFVDADGQVTPTGKQVSALGTHPRVAALLLHGPNAQPWWQLMALAMHFDWPLETALADWLGSAIQEYRRNKQWQQLAERWQRVLNAPCAIQAQLTPLTQEQADNLARFFSSRLGKQTQTGRYRLNSGISVAVAGANEWALVLHIQRRGREHYGVGVALHPSAEQIRELAEPRTHFTTTGQGQRRRWIAQTQFYLGGQVVAETQRELAADEVPAAVLQHIQKQGLEHIHWPPAALDLLLRARWAQQLGGLDLPPLDMASLSTALDTWLGSFINAETDLEHLPLAQGLQFYLGYNNAAAINEYAPAQLTIPSGRSVKVDYQAEADANALVASISQPLPSIAAKLQEFFGAEQLGPKALPLQIKLLSPAGRPLAITQDLAYFWREVYPQVRKEVRGRYAKHPWPEDPLAHTATAKTKRRLAAQ